jgi:hypothetical protein
MTVVTGDDRYEFGTMDGADLPAIEHFIDRSKHALRYLINHCTVYDQLVCGICRIGADWACAHTGLRTRNGNLKTQRRGMRG